MSRPLLALALALLFVPSARAADLPVREVWLTADVTVDAQGRIEALEWVQGEALEHLVAPRIEAKVRAWEFTPGAIDGVAAPTQTSLSVQVRAEALADGGLALKFLDAFTGPRVVSLTAPRYPKGAIRQGFDAQAMVDFEVLADGSVKVHDVEVATNGKAGVFAAAVREHAATWRYRPELVGDRVLPVRRKSPVWFCVQGGARSWCDKRKAELAAKAAARTAEEAAAAAASQSAVALRTDIRAQDI
jgi:hypothetical protein